MKPLVSRSLPVVAILVVTMPIVVALFSVAYDWGEQSAHRTASGDAPTGTPPDGNVLITTPFRIVGDSMAPTLVDGEVCQIAKCRTLQIGDVVAIRWGGKRHVKRVAAVGGDVVDRVGGRLTVGGKRLEDRLAERDTDEFLSPALVPVSSQPHHWSRDAAVPSRLVYSHHNPHQAGRITAVMDDYPSNETVRRVLNPVDRLVVEIRARDKDAAPLAPLRVFFFDAQHAMVSTTTTTGWARFRDAAAVAVEDLAADLAPGTAGQSERRGMLDAAHPIAVELGRRQASRYTLHVYREIEYRDDRPSGNVKYPITLDNDEVFVVGDNVPVSVDSRALGPLPRAAIEGCVVNPGG
ncbi:Peptidase S24-like protein [Stieleria neptunia]|uniref:Signal peptidase I n=1 Tax=Stieleria neptunia TaxID=2527979 RepID=A0A518HM20_9BACT|nr:S26 family signal peptidase [Stieleria neptunia]QDV41827.1 Peptidase S24-like protein [Stieleria neptunia]